MIAAMQYRVTARIGERVSTIETHHVPTVAEVWTLLNSDVKQALPAIGGKIVDWFTYLVPGAIVDFLIV